MAANDYYNPRANPIFNWMYGNKDDELQLKLRAAIEEKKGDNEIALIKAEIDADTQHQQQQLMKIAQGPGMSMTGVSHGGRGMPYGDTAMFNPKAMPPRYISGTRPRDEEDKPPGLATFSPYRMYS